ncbi:hypothetical protein [Vibrio breoganii]|uniref:hypothetical protein n=1 Tax=Vibrio breoganii TaxID=553239 RepID=UPI000C8199C4|nr:hypothetical protein [Vibrio breoganii]PML16375.1 hypothetical protein BCT84_06490 [Vibrio breoganii]
MAGGRWLTNFENHGFWKSWYELLDYANSSPKPNDATIVDEVSELSRLVKAIIYLNDIIDSCDPELVPIDVWANTERASAQCLIDLNSYTANKSLTYLRRANDQLDTILSYVRPHMMVKGNAAKSLGRATRHSQQAILGAG